jgi:hypothetical protein
VFVSYSRHDEPLVRPLAGLLGAAADDAVFLDLESIKPGDLWKNDIENAVRASSVFILCWCCQSKTSEFVHYEIEIALERAEKRLVPVLFCSTPLPQTLTDRQWVDLRGRVIHSCQHNLKQSGQVVGQPPIEPTVAPAAITGRYPPAMRWAPILLIIFLPILAYFWTSTKRAPPSHPTTSVERSTRCLLLSGPRAGQIQDLGGPLPVGSPCGDGAGSEGEVVALHTAPASAPVSTAYRVVIISSTITLGLVIIIVLPLWLYKVLRQRHRRREADKIAALATTYFEQF